ncbi:MAG: hypothetical protein GAK29_00863 [Acinetobacter bereziniae]|uniref:Uncharacterized protein n=1 Tax=Acinetobacter bereziniae TaxID=106648 RepID=A0A833UED4_ACIBZ|nr:MAG: hypothetical protein GAK29_00863 [Acinetobacter bereziniae]
MNFKLKLGEIPNLGNIVNAVWRVNGKRGDVVLNAEDVGADPKGSADNIKEQLAVEWVPVEQVGFLNNIAVENVIINGISHGIELARIDGNLWIRGMLNHKYYGNANPIFTLRDKNYKVFATGPSYAPIAFILFASSNDNGTIKYVSNLEVYDEQTAIDVDQMLTQQYTFLPGLFYIQPQAVGKLVLP